jgi:hypothetical protein
MSRRSASSAPSGRTELSASPVSSRASSIETAVTLLWRNRERAALIAILVIQVETLDRPWKLFK